MTEIDRATIAATADRVAPHIRRTPVLDVGEIAGARVTLKLDLLQPTGSFKVRGAFARLTEGPIPTGGVVAASGGNFGLAVAYAARRLGVPATVFVPELSPPAKVRRLESLGADVRTAGAVYAESLEASREYHHEGETLFCHAYDQPAVVAGQGTVGMEMLDQAPATETILVAVGGAGLIGGVASWVREDARLVAVETEGTPTLHAALAAGEPVDVEVAGEAASSLGASRVGEIGFDAARRWVDDSLLVTEEQVRDGQAWLWETARIVAEPGAAAVAAALLGGAYRPGSGERVTLLVCGGNTDPGAVDAR